MKRFVKDDRGATAIEYGLIVALIFLAVITGLTVFGQKNDNRYQFIQSELDKVV